MENDNFYSNNNDPYANPPQNQPEHQPPQNHTGQSFGMSTASLILGILCVVTTCCLYISIPLGILSIILATLSKGSLDQMNSQGKTGMGLSIAGICITIILTIVVFFSQITYVGTDAFRKQFKEYLDYYNRDSSDSDFLQDWFDETPAPSQDFPDAAV